METLLLLLPYAVPAVGIVGCLVLFLTLKSEMRTGHRKLLATCGSIEYEWKTRLDQLEKKCQEIAAQPPPAPSRAAIDFARRSQALQLYRQGEPPEHIAAALGLPRNEVDLLLKMNAMVLQSAAVRSGL